VPGRSYVPGMKHLLFVSLAFVMACGGKSAPKKTEPTDDPDKYGIGAAEAGAQACFEDCYDKGPEGTTDWATKSEDDKRAACNESCKAASAGLPSDQPAE